METEFIIEEAKEHFQKSLEHLQREFAQIQAGQANPAMVENLLIDAYGSLSPLKNNANISTPEPQQLSIEPYDRGLVQSIETAIRKSDLGLNPLNDGSGRIRLNIPPLTEERRRGLVKVVHTKSEEAKVGIRKSRQDAIQHIRALDGVSEDIIKHAEEQLQTAVTESNKKVDELTKHKEGDVMRV